jgi:hypothetical protein
MQLAVYLAGRVLHVWLAFWLSGCLDVWLAACASSTSHLASSSFQPQLHLPSRALRSPQPHAHHRSTTASCSPPQHHSRQQQVSPSYRHSPYSQPPHVPTPPAGDATSGIKNSEVQQVPLNMADQIYFWQGRFREACGNDSNAGVWPPGRKGTPSWLRDVDAMERVLHDSMALFMAMATEMLASNAQLHEDLRRGLLTVTLQCEATRCMSVLSIIGVALGYAGWLEMLACFVILSFYLRGRPRERITTSQLMAVITDAPEIPTPDDAIPGQGTASGRANDCRQTSGCAACHAAALVSDSRGTLPLGESLVDVAAASMTGAGSVGACDSRTSRDSTANVMDQSKAE